MSLEVFVECACRVCFHAFQLLGKIGSLLILRLRSLRYSYFLPPPPLLFPVLFWGLSGFFLPLFIFLLLGNRIMGGWIRMALRGKGERIGSDRDGWEHDRDGWGYDRDDGWVDDGMIFVLV